MQNVRSRSAVLLIALFSAAFLLIVGCASVPEDPAELAERQATISGGLESGWNCLWSDRFADAETHFRGVLEQDDAVTEARRGLGLALFARGRCFEAAEELITAIEREPDSPFSTPMQHFITAQVPYRKSTRDRLAEANERHARDKEQPWVRRQGLLGLQAQYRISEPSLVGSTGNDLGAVSGWSVLGPFSNVSRSGFDEPFIEETNIASRDLEAALLGLDNREVAWFTPDLQDPGGWVSFSGYLGYPSYFTAYGRAEVEIKEEGHYYLVFDRGGAIQCWVDDEKVLCDAGYRYGPEVHWLKRILEEGTHDILVKVSCEGRPAGFRLSIIDADFGISKHRPSKHYSELFPPDDLFGFDPLLSAMAARLDADVGDRETRFWLAYALTTKGHAYESLGLVEESREYLPSAEGAYFDLLESLNHRFLDKPNEARNSLIRSHERGVTFAPAVVHLLREHIEGQRWDRAEELLARAGEAFGQWYHGRLYAVWLAASRDGVDDAFEEMARFFEDFSDVPELDLMLYESEFGFEAYPALTLLDRIDDKGLPVLASRRKLDRYMEGSGGYFSYLFAYNLASNLKDDLPAVAAVWHAYAASAYFTGEWNSDRLHERVSGLLGSFPFSTGLIELELNRASGRYNSLKKQLREKSNSAEVQKDLETEMQRYGTILKRYLGLFPENYTAREELRELNGLESLERIVASTEAIDFIDAFEKEDPTYEEDAVVVLSEDIHLYFGDGGTRSSSQEIIKILSRNGVRDNSTYRMDYHSLYDHVELREAYVMKPDRSQTQPVRAGEKLSFPGLDVGDYIVVRYTRDSSGFGSLNREFWGQSIFNGFYPVYRKSFRLIHPSSRDLRVEYHNAEGKEIEESTSEIESGMTELTIAASRMASVKLEGWIPDWRDVLAWVDVSSVDSWDSIVRWYGELSEGQCIITPEIRTIVAELTEGGETREELIESIFDFVSREIDYEDLSFMYSAYVPQKADSVLADGYGDCKDQSTLLITLLKAAGIDSHIALNSPGYRGEHFYLPSPRFSHAVVVVPDQNGDLILDPTTEYYSYPELPPPLIGSYYLPIRRAGTRGAGGLRRIEPAREPGETYYLVELTPSADGGALRGTAVYAGFHAGVVRSLLQSGSAEYREQAFGFMLQDGVAGFTLTSLDTENEDDLRLSPLVDFTGTTPASLLRLDGSLFALDIPWFVRLSPSLRSIGASGSRENDVRVIYFDHASPCRQVTVIGIPEGFTLHSVPEDAVFEYGDVSVGYRYASRGDTLICERFVHIPILSIPVEELEGFNILKEEIFRKEQEKIILRAVAEGR